MAEHTNSNIAQCPECDGLVRLNGKLKVGKTLSCRKCGSTLVIAERKPLELVPEDGNFSANGQSNARSRKPNSGKASKKRQVSGSKESLAMTTSIQVKVADCPECCATLRFHRPLKDRQLVVCPECSETLEVVSLRPLELDWANDDPWQYEENHDRRRPVGY